MTMRCAVFKLKRPLGLCGSWAKSQDVSNDVSVWEYQIQNMDMASGFLLSFLNCPALVLLCLLLWMNLVATVPSLTLGVGGCFFMIEYCVPATSATFQSNRRNWGRWIRVRPVKSSVSLRPWIGWPLPWLSDMWQQRLTENEHTPQAEKPSDCLMVHWDCHIRKQAAFTVLTKTTEEDLNSTEVLVYGWNQIFQLNWHLSQLKRLQKTGDSRCLCSAHVASQNSTWRHVAALDVSTSSAADLTWDEIHRFDDQCKMYQNNIKIHQNNFDTGPMYRRKLYMTGGNSRLWVKKWRRTGRMSKARATFIQEDISRSP